MKLKEYAGVARANFLLLPFTLVAVGEFVCRDNLDRLLGEGDLIVEELA